MKIRVRYIAHARLTSSIEVLPKEVALSNTRTPNVMHIPNTLSLIWARIDRNRKF